MAIKKQWYEIISPKMFGEKQVGETLAVDPKQLIGRKIDVSMMDLSRDFSKFYIRVRFKIKEVEGTRAYTEITGHDVMRERIYRMIQRRMRRIDAIQDVSTKDGSKIRVKTVFILTKRVGTSVKDDARKKCKEIIENLAGENNAEDFIKMVLSGEAQKKVRQECHKISPVGNIEIRKTEILHLSEQKNAEKSAKKELQKENVKETEHIIKEPKSKKEKPNEKPAKKEKSPAKKDSSKEKKLAEKKSKSNEEEKISDDKE